MLQILVQSLILNRGYEGIVNNDKTEPILCHCFVPAVLCLLTM